jgi:hypothetical protein
MDITITVEPDVQTKLQQKADAAGQDIKKYVEEIVRTQVLHPSLDEILAPVRQEFAESGMTEDELDALIKQERRILREEKNGKKR